MSKTIANVIHGLIGLATLPLNERQKDKTIARVAEDVTRRSRRIVETARGPLSFYAMRGHGTISAVRNFHNEEPETLEWIDTYIKPGDVFWDIGANIGLYTLYAALNPQVTVYAFEPSALNFSLLVEHIHLNNLDRNINPLCVALGNETKIGHLMMNDFSTGHAGNALDKAETQFLEFKPVFRQSIPAFTADDFRRLMNVPAPDHIKLDVDGIEDLILAGAPETLRHVKSLIIEIEGRNVDNVRDGIEKPLFAAGLKEDERFRAKGSKRNRLFVRA
ncbi:MAG: FkbM family methyltransferase [Micavibrio aeruginosavorus]|nr:FkbM family methyltransferase [Micavibrio aeruginosavorus]